jgi:hypothetical protein
LAADASAVNGDGSFRPSNNGAFQVGTYDYSILVADFNQDGKLDIAAVSFDGATATVLLGDGSGRFSPAPDGPFPIANLSERAAVGDIDGDGTPDLVRFARLIELSVIETIESGTMTKDLATISDPKPAAWADTQGFIDASPGDVHPNDAGLLDMSNKLLEVV